MVGIWSFIFALIACLKWEKEECGTRPDASEIWWRFPKFVLGFFIASVIITIITSGYSQADYDKIIKPELIKLIKSLRSWAFILPVFEHRTDNALQGTCGCGERNPSGHLPSGL